MTQPGYLDLLASGELERRIERLHALLAAGTVCPRDCDNDRLAGVLHASVFASMPGNLLRQRTIRTVWTPAETSTSTT